MFQRSSVVLSCLAIVFVAGTSVTYPVTDRAPQIEPHLRDAREVNEEPLWLYQDDNIDRAPAIGDHPYLPPHIDDVKIDPNTRYARSVDSPSAKRGGGSHTTSSGSRDTGATHPGYNRRNTRSIYRPSPFDPLPSPTFPKPLDPFLPRPRVPGPRPIYPIYARHTRDVQLSPALKKPTHYDISLPGWNPNARVQPWQKIRVRNGRDIHDEEYFVDSLDD